MNYNKIFKAAFSDVALQTDEESFVKSVTERKIAMESKKKASIKKPLIALCAAVAAISLSAAGAAAAGFINFNEIFGNIIRTDNTELGEALIGNAENIRWTVSDEDYVVNLKGVTGTNERVMAVVEIARADGTPVENYLNNKDILAETNLYSASVYMGLSNPDVNIGRSTFAYVNEIGNIEVNYQIYLGTYDTCGLTSLNGERIYFEGLGFYPMSVLHTSIPFSSPIFQQNGIEVSEKDRSALEEISVLFLDWSMEFDYIPSETSETTYTAPDLSQPSYFECDIQRYTDKNGNGEIEEDTDEIELVKKNERFEMAFDKITVSSIDGSFSGKAVLGEYAAQDIHCSWDFDIEFIKKDGSKSDVTILMTSGTYGTNFETGIMEFDYAFEYHCNGGQTAVDLSEISAISINNTIYNLQ